MKYLWLIPLALMVIVGSAIADDITASATVQKYISVTFNYNSVSFGTVTAGSSDNHPTPDYTTGVYNVTIDTNYAYNVNAYGTDFSDGAGHTFSISNLKMGVNTTTDFYSFTALSTSSQTIYSGSETDMINYHAFLLSVPSGQYAGSYSSTVTIDYVNQ